MTGCAGPDALMRVHAYDAPKKDANKLATIYGVWNGAGGEQTFICSVDGKSYRKMGAISNCPSVVYVPEGRHELGIKYTYANYYADKSVTLNFVAGRTYEVRAVSNANLSSAQFEAFEMPESFALKYKDLVPVLKDKFKGKGEELVLPADAD